MFIVRVFWVVGRMVVWVDEIVEMMMEIMSI